MSDCGSATVSTTSSGRSPEQRAAANFTRAKIATTPQANLPASAAERSFGHRSCQRNQEPPSAPIGGYLRARE
jgi:hypothetical protein